MAILPKSKKARRRLGVIAVAGVILAAAAGLSMYAMRDAISFFYSPSQAQEAKVPAGRTIQLGGMVSKGSVVKHADGSVEFVVADAQSASHVVFKGDLPDLFREGQGVVTKGSYDHGGVFRASQVLAKHDEKYMPRELEKALKDSGEWRGEGGKPGYAYPTPVASAP
jgi:cytochrome c-type biogenesis protein CcmE